VVRLLDGRAGDRSGGRLAFDVERYRGVV